MQAEARDLVQSILDKYSHTTTYFESVLNWPIGPGLPTGDDKPIVRRHVSYFSRGIGYRSDLFFRSQGLESLSDILIWNGRDEMWWDGVDGWTRQGMANPLIRPSTLFTHQMLIPENASKIGTKGSVDVEILNECECQVVTATRGQREHRLWVDAELTVRRVEVPYEIRMNTYLDRFEYEVVKFDTALPADIFEGGGLDQPR